MDDFGSSITTDGILQTNGDAVVAVHEARGDDDWFRLELEKYYTYDIVIDPDTSAARPAKDLFSVRFLDDEGREQSRTVLYDSLENASIRPSYSGTHFVSHFNGEGAYSIAVKIRDDFEASLSLYDDETTTRVGAIETVGDQDSLRYRLRAGFEYSVNVADADSSSVTLANPRLQIHDMEGNRVESGESSESSITFVPERTGHYDFAVSSADGGTGSYRIDFPGMDDYEADITTSGTVTVGTPKKGNIFLSLDDDWFRVELEQGLTYRFATQLDPDSAIGASQTVGF